MIKKAFVVLLSFFLIPNIALASDFWDIFEPERAIEFYSLPRWSEDNVVGEIKTVQVEQGDTLQTLAQYYKVGHDELKEANPGVNFKRLKIGQEIVLPTLFILPDIRQGIVINQAEKRLYYFTPDGRGVWTFPIALGRPKWRTPNMETKVISKKKDPVWRPTERIKEYEAAKGNILPDQVPAGPGNPLGYYAIRLATGVHLIHGTNNKSTIGLAASSGCIRMYPAHIETLFNMVAIDTPVVIINQPYKIGQRGKKVFLEVHKSLSGLKKVSEKVLDAKLQQLKNRGIGVDLLRVGEILEREIKTGIPERVDSRYTRKYAKNSQSNKY